MRTKVRHKGTRWYVTTIDDADHETGHGGYTTKREATKVAAQIATDAGRGNYVKPDSLTVGEYLIDEWLPSRENSDISTNTRDVDRTVVEAWILPHIGDVKLQKLTARDLDDLYRILRTKGGRNGKGLRGKSVRNTHATLSKALGDAVRRGHLLVNPILAVDPPARDDSVERVAWTRDEVRAFLAAAEDDRLGAIFRLALATGLRRGELLDVAWSDVDLDKRELTVRRQVLVRPRSVRNVQRVYVRETTKTRRVRRVRFDEQTAAALRKWKTAQAGERLEFGPAYKSDGGLRVEASWIVTEADGAVVHPDTLLARFRRLAIAAKVPPIPLHAARHTYAELALGAGVRLDVVSRQLGHASISTTANVYSHDTDEAAADAAEKVGNILDAGQGA